MNAFAFVIWIVSFAFLIKLFNEGAEDLRARGDEEDPWQD